MTQEIEDKGTHQIIKPPNDLRQKTKPSRSSPPNFDPIAKAEQALHQMSGNFTLWIEEEVAALVKAWSVAREAGLSTDSMDDLFRAAIDIKGQAETFGYPIAGSIADSLCRLVEHGQEGNQLPEPLLDQHVQAVRAVVRERAKGDDSQIALSLLHNLTDVTNDYIAQSA
ncbi:Hpt domain-containing protein [Coralliovum pocilloporae]|uniref:Hpt domain-containing protein n=1 Tax=Coralliovum pocilloporae TaxID=3066369 RepID=UPI00330786F9